MDAARDIFLPVEEGIRRALDEYTRAWNSHDSEQLGELYAEDARYAGKSEGEPVLLQGRKEIVEHYRNEFPAPEDMGTLGLTLCDCYRFRANYRSGRYVASVLVQYRLHIEEESVTGYAMLILAQDKDSQYLIVQEISM